MDNSNYEKKPIGKMGVIIIVLAIAIVISMVIIGVAIVSIVKGDSSSNTLNYDYSYSENPDLYQTTQSNLGDYFTDDVVTDSFSEPVSANSGQQGSGSDNKNTTKNAAIEN